MHLLVENVKVVEAIAPQAGGSAINGDFINMKKCASVAVLVHVNQGNAATVAITLEQAKDVSGTDAKALAKSIPIHLVADAAASDSFVRQADGVAYTTTATLKHKLVMFEVPASALDLANGFKTIRVKAGASNAANIVAAQYLAHGLRHGGASMITN